MNLHRASTQADWQAIKPTERNLFQRVAAATMGVVSPGNVISLVGFILVIIGLSYLLDERYLLSLVLLAVGRLLDVADGAVAEATGTKSPLGEIVDATIDKLVTVMTVIAILLTDLAAWWVVAALVILQISIGLVVFIRRSRGSRIHPTRTGKLSMATAWIGIVGLILIEALNGQLVVVSTVYGFIVLSLVLGVVALCQYATFRAQD